MVRAQVHSLNQLDSLEVAHSRRNCAQLLSAENNRTLQCGDCTYTAGRVRACIVAIQTVKYKEHFKSLLEVSFESLFGQGYDDLATTFDDVTATGREDVMHMVTRMKVHIVVGHWHLACTVRHLYHSL